MFQKNKNNRIEGVVMSINNSILKLLNMKDKNLNFTENFVEERNIKNRR